MDSKRAWIGYSVIRVLAFFVPFVIVMVAFPTWQYNWLVGVILGTIVGVAVSYIFLRRQRMRMVQDLADLRARKDKRSALDREEDALIDGDEKGDSRAERAEDTGGADVEPRGPATPTP